MSAIVDNGPFYNAAPDIDEDEINLGDLIGVLIENRWLIIGITFAALLFGAYRAFTAVPIYQADGLLQVEEKKSGLGDLDISQLLGGGEAPISAEIEILRSRSVLGTVVDNLQLDIYAEPNLSVIAAALARRSEPSSRPKIQVDTLNLPDYMLGQTLTLIASGSSKYELLDEMGESLLHGTVGETATRPMPGWRSDHLVRFVITGRPERIRRSRYSEDLELIACSLCREE